MLVREGIGLEGKKVWGQRLKRETIWETCSWIVGSWAQIVHLSEWEGDMGLRPVPL